MAALATVVATLAGAAGAATVWAVAPVATQGRVVDVHGSPVPSASVELVAASGHVPAVRTDPLGRFSLRGSHQIAGPGLVVSAPGFAPARVQASTGLVVLRHWPEVGGQVQDEAGTALAEATVQLSQDRGHGVWTTVADASGGFGFSGRIEPGRYHLSVSAAYHDPFSTALSLAYDQKLELGPVAPRQLSSLTLTSQPARLRPLLDGAPVPGCVLTPCTALILAGPHVVAIESEPYVPWRQEIWTARDESLGLSPVLERKTGTLSIAVPDLPRSLLRIDGSAVGSGSWTGKLPIGEHRIDFTAARTWPFSGTAHVDWDVETRLEVGAATIIPRDAAGFLSGLKAYLSGLGGRYGLYLEELDSGRELGYGDSATMDAASVIKLPVALDIYHQVESGAVGLDDTVTLQDGDFMAGSGLLYYNNQPGDSFTYAQLVQLLIQQSDNTAWRALLRVLGGDQVDSFAASLGGGECIQAADTCTPRAAGRLLVQLATGTALNRTDTSALLGLLETTVFNDRINFYLDGIPIAHKVGMRGGVINDAGIVYLPGNPFVLAMFTDTDDPDGGVQVIRDVARAAAAYYGR